MMITGNPGRAPASAKTPRPLNIGIRRSVMTTSNRFSESASFFTTVTGSDTPVTCMPSPTSTLLTARSIPGSSSTTKTDLSCNSSIIFQRIELRHTANRRGAMVSRANQFSRIAAIRSRKKQIVMSGADSQRKLNAKGAAFPPRRSAINLPAMFIDDLLGICETEAGAIALRGEKWDEKIPGFFLGHAPTVIADGYQDLRLVPFAADCQISASGHRVHRITD